MHTVLVIFGGLGLMVLIYSIARWRGNTLRRAFPVFAMLWVAAALANLWGRIADLRSGLRRPLSCRLVSCMAIVMTDPRIGEVIAWWRSAAENWFSQSPDFDAAVRRSFALLHKAAMAGELAEWRDTPEGCLALVILLDQYPRNAFRGTREMYRADPQALSVARHACRQGFIDRFPQDLRLFTLLPFSHSETLEDQDQSVALHGRYLRSGLHRARCHRDIIARFGRFPHRQPIFERALTPEETRYLNDGGFQG
mgnify:CR=1 FL=1